MAAGDAAGLPHGQADCAPHVASVFKHDVRHTIAGRYCTQHRHLVNGDRVTARNRVILGLRL